MRLTELLSLILPSLVPALAFAQESEQSYEEKRATFLAHFRSYEYGAKFLREAADTPYIEVDFEDLPKVIMGQMANHLTPVQQKDARPQQPGAWDKPGRMSVRVFASDTKELDDLVEYRWMHMGQNLRVVASRNAARLDLDLDEVDQNPELRQLGSTQLQRVRALVEGTVRLHGEAWSDELPAFDVEIPWPDALSDGMRFSTNPEQSIQAMDGLRWFTRVDFFVHDAVLSVMFYFKLGQRAGPEDGSKWFDDNFRAQVRERAREQGKIPAEPVPERP